MKAICNTGPPVISVIHVLQSDVFVLLYNDYVVSGSSSWHLLTNAA